MLLILKRTMDTIIEIKEYFTNDEYENNLKEMQEILKSKNIVLTYHHMKNLVIIKFIAILSLIRSVYDVKLFNELLTMIDKKDNYCINNLFKKYSKNTITNNNHHKLFEKCLKIMIDKNDSGGIDLLFDLCVSLKAFGNYYKSYNEYSNIIWIFDIFENILPYDNSGQILFKIGEYCENHTKNNKKIRLLSENCLIKSIKLFNNNARNLLTMIKSKNDLKIITTKLTKYVLSEHMKRYGNINENLTFNNESQNTIDNNLTSNTVTPIFNNEIQELLKNNSNTILHNENIVMFNENILDNEYSLNVGDNDYLWL